MTFKQSFMISLIFFLAVAISFAGGYLTHSYLPGMNGKFPILNESYSLLTSHGLQDMPSPPALEYGMIRGMIQAYGDPFTAFLEPAMTELEGNTLQGSFGGIGVQMGTDDEGYVLLYPFPDSPAAKAGVVEGARLIAVEDLPIPPGMPFDQIQAAIRGPVGEAVALTIVNPPDPTEQVVSIQRQEIPLPSVTFHIDPSNKRMGLVQVNIIAASTAREIQDAVKDMQSRGATHFVLDLRDNGGGLLSAGIDIARLFLDEGTIIQQQYKGKPVETYDVEEPGPLTKIPLTVLVNRNTASASEIIAGSLQAHGRAQLVGEPTFGKNTIQLIFSLQDGSSLHITAARWWIPGLDFPTNGHGLEPDVLFSVESSPETDPMRVVETIFFGGN